MLCIYINTSYICVYVLLIFWGVKPKARGAENSL